MISLTNEVILVLIRCSGWWYINGVFFKGSVFTFSEKVKTLRSESSLFLDKEADPFRNYLPKKHVEQMSMSILLLNLYFLLLLKYLSANNPLGPA